WKTLWPLFGSANQLMASLALLAGTVWLFRMGKDNKFVLYPMIFMLAVTLTALVFMFLKTVAAANFLQAAICVVLFILAIVLVYLAITTLRRVGKERVAAA
ncbi:MAG: carbon starvation CstA family protein, partial [Dehalococcoidales bacterium]